MDKTCSDCQKEFSLEHLIIQTTIFFTEEYYCEECWDRLIEEQK